MTALTGKKPKDTYRDLLQVSNANKGIDESLRPIEDGEGTRSALSLSTAQVSLAGNELVLDRDGDTSIAAADDDRIDIKLAGAVDFRFRESAFDVLAGSTLTLKRGASLAVETDATLAEQALEQARGLGSGRLDTAGLPPGYDGADLAALRGRTEQAAYRRALDLLDPEIERQERRLRQSLANRGLPIASGSAGGDEFGQFLDAGNRARQDAAYAAVAQGGAEADRAFNRATSSRQQGFAERAALRQQQFNELAALLGGQQVAPVGLPRFAPTAGIDVLGSNALSQQAGLNRYNAQLQQYNQFRQGLGQAIGTAATFFAPSSRAFKTGNRPADHSDSLARLRDLDVEHWRYRGDANPHIGPYAEDFAAAFAGDGRTIDLMDAIGATMSAVKGLAARVEALAGRLDGTGRTQTGERRC